MQQNRIADGQRTKVIYTLIKEAKYHEVTVSRFRLLTTSAMSSSFALEADPCRCLPIATT